MRTEKKAALIVAGALLIVGLGMAAVSLVSVGSDYNKLVKQNTYEEKTYDVTEDFKNISMEIGSHDINILRSDDKDAHFVCSESDQIKYDVQVKNNTLFIKEKANKIFNFSFVFDQYPIVSKLYLPKDTYEIVSCRLGSGDITITEKFSFDELSFKVGSGDIVVSDASCKNKFSADASSGKLKITNTLSQGSFYARTGSGDIDLTACEGMTFEVKTGSGDISLSSCDGTSISMSTGSGDITGTVKTAKTFDAKAGSGDVRVPVDGNGGTCTIRTGSGDIKITEG